MEQLELKPEEKRKIVKVFKEFVYDKTENLHESQHKPGEKFNEDYNYAGVKRKPLFREIYELNGNAVDNIGAVLDSYDDGYREILVPRKKKAQTTVTHWSTNTLDGIPCYQVCNGCFKGSYSFKGKPDVDRVVGEMLVDARCQAVKIECTEEFTFATYILEKACYIFDKSLKMTKDKSWSYKEKYRGWHIMNNYHDITDTDIEEVIAEYAKKQRAQAETVTHQAVVTMSDLDAITRRIDELWNQSEALAKRIHRIER